MTASPIRLTPFVLGGVLIALTVPPLVIAAGGGGELGVGPLRLAFYDLPSSVFCLLGGALWLGRRSRGAQVESILSGLSWVGLSIASLVLWLPPSGVPAWLDMNPGNPLIAGILILGLSALAGRLGRGPHAVSHLPGTLTLLVALLAGVILHGAMVSVDRSALAEQLNRSLAIEVTAAEGGGSAVTSLGAMAGTDAETPTEPNHHGAGSSGSATHPNLLLIVVDTLRADALENTAELPFFASLAERSLVFDRAMAPAPWTVPSMMALMTGRYPSSLDPEGRGRAWPKGFAEARPLHSAVPRLGELLSAAGYRTAGFVKNPFLAGGLGIGRGFDVYERVFGDTAEHGSAGQLVNAALRWAGAIQRPLGGGTTLPGAERTAAARDGSAPAPWFLYLHFMDPHVNYQPPATHLPTRARDYDGEIDGRASTLHRMIAAQPEPVAADVNQLKDLYAGEVSYLDEQLGRLFAELGEQGLLGADTAIVLTADHGEQFGEHGGWLHGDIHRENAQVPLMLQGSDLAPGRRTDPASLVDILPTLGHLLRLPSLSVGDGRNLLAPDASSHIDAVHTEYGQQSRLTGPRFSLLVKTDGQASLYDSHADPEEQEDIAMSHADVVAEMLKARDAHLARPPLDLPAEPSDSAAEHRAEVELDTDALRAIGYIDG